MTDEVLKELWNTKDSIAKEHGYSIDGLAEYYLAKQLTRRGRFQQEEKTLKAEQVAQSDAPHEGLVFPSALAEQRAA